MTFARYKLYRNKLTHLLRISERKYVRDYLNKYVGDLKKSWKLVNDLIGRNNKLKHLPKSFETETGSSITEPKAIANYFNQYFSNVAPQLASKLKQTNTNPMQFMETRVRVSIFLKPVRQSELLDAFDMLKDTSSGFDQMKPIVLKKVKNELLHPVMNLINASFQQGIFPDQLKTACVTPIHKQGITSCVSNYRPVSVLCAMSKIFERIMFNRLMDYVTKFNLLYKDQYGFRKGFSTDLAIIRVTEYMHKALDEKQHVIGLYMDLAKAFDTINHEILINKLDYYGIRGQALIWFKSYLTNREQMVKYNGVLSDRSKISYGVPQGSILGPILFLLYINDLYLVSKKLLFIMFADDTSVFVKGSNLSDSCSFINAELEKVAEWFCANRLSLNVSKTHFMIFSNNNYSNHVIKIGDEEISQVANTKFLGVIIDDKLSWKEHISHINGKINRGIGILYKLRNVLTQRWRIKLYNTFVLPYFNYCNIIWCSTCPTYLKNIIVTQKRALKIALNVDKKTSSEVVFSQAKALSLRAINNVQTGIFMFKYFSHLLPFSYDFQCFFNCEIHSHFTRSAFNVHTTRPSTNKFKFSLSIRGPKLWNSLPSEIKYLSSLLSVKKSLKLYFSNAL